LRKAVKGESVQSIAHSLEVHMADEPRRPRELQGTCRMLRRVVCA
jgi:hypothetical protein